MRRPNFVLLGQGKAGTSLIWRVLRRHPDIAFPKKKELHFFGRKSDKPLPWYDAQFEGLPQQSQYIGEISPSYLDPIAIRRIHATLGPDVRFAFVLRRPIEQAFSRYMQNICARPEPYGFDRFERVLPTFLKRIANAIEIVFDLYGTDAVLPLFYEKDVARPDPCFEAKILTHLDLPVTNHTAEFLTRPRVNSGVLPRYLFDAEKDQIINLGGSTYHIPAGHLVFCAQARNARINSAPTAEDLNAARTNTAAWTTELTEADYARLQNKVVLPVATNLEDRFGFDLSHWRVAPRALRYDAAPPPGALKVAPR
ncbi:MAG: sulfotransferase [Pseudomonadota bacterium]